jgi:hypothetical protein
MFDPRRRIDARKARFCHVWVHSWEKRQAKLRGVRGGVFALPMIGILRRSMFTVDATGFASDITGFG